MTSSTTRWLPLTGILSIALIVGGILLGEPPDASHPPQEIVDFYVENKAKMQYGTIAFGAAMILLVAFASYLRSVLNRGEGSTDILPVVAVAGATIFAVGGAIDAMIIFGISEAVDDLDPTQVQTLQALWDNDWLPLLMGAVMLTLASGLSIVRHRSLPVWLGWLALVIGIVGLTPFGWAAFLAAGVWILMVCVTLLVTERGASTPAVES
jgi:hypothetical protein